MSIHKNVSVVYFMMSFLVAIVQVDWRGLLYTRNLCFT